MKTFTKVTLSTLPWPTGNTREQVSSFVVFSRFSAALPTFCFIHTPGSASSPFYHPLIIPLCFGVSGPMSVYLHILLISHIPPPATCHPSVSLCAYLYPPPRPPGSTLLPLYVPSSRHGQMPASDVTNLHSAHPAQVFSFGYVSEKTLTAVNRGPSARRRRRRRRWWWWLLLPILGQCWAQ